MQASPTLSLSGHVFKNNDLSQSLLGLPHLANIGHNIHLDKNGISITNEGNLVLSGSKGPTEKLWTISLPSCPSTAYVAVHNTSSAEIVKFVSAVFFNTPDSTLLKAVDKGWLKFPGVTANMVRQNPPNSIETALGHLDLNAKNQRSTKSNKRRKQRSTSKSPSQSQTEEDFSSDPLDENICSKIFDTQHSDATGKFPAKSRRGNRYILVSVYRHYIHMEPFASRSAEDYTDAYRRTLTFFAHFGPTPKIIRLDNEISATLITFFKDEAKAEYEHVPVNNHRANKAERSIRTAKNHLISGLVGTHPDFPASEWDELLPQAEITLNQLRPWAGDHSISAYRGLYGNDYDHESHPMGPAGCEVLAFESPLTRASWDVHGVRAFYLRPALDHYRNYWVYVPSTRKLRSTDTLHWFPEKVIMPGASLGDRLLLAITDLEKSLSNISGHRDMEENYKPTFNRHALMAISALKILRDLYVQPSQEQLDSQVQIQRVGLPIPGDNNIIVQPLPVQNPHVVTSLPILSNRRPDEIQPVLPIQRVIIRNNVIPELTQPIETRPIIQNHVSTFSSMPNTILTSSTNTTVPQPASSQLSGPSMPNTILTSFTNTTVPQPASSQLSGPDSAGSFHRNTTILDTSLMDEQRRGQLSTSDAQQQKLSRNARKIAREKTQDLLFANSSLPSVAYIVNEYPVKNEYTEESSRSFDDIQEVHGANLSLALSSVSQRNSSDHPPPHMLNLSVDGSNLTFNKAIMDENWDRNIHFSIADANEFDKYLGQTKTMHAIHTQDIAPDRRKDITYYSKQIKEKINENEEYSARVRGVAGGDRIIYPGDVSQTVAVMSTVKIFLNSVVSEDADFMTIDIKDFYIGTPMERPEYIRIPAKCIPPSIMAKYNLSQYVDRNGNIIFEINKTLWGLPQAGRLSKNRLCKHLASHGYHECKNTSGLFRHETLPIAFTLVVDDFGVKFPKDQRNIAQHLIDSLTQNGMYNIRISWEGRKYLGYTIEYDKAKREMVLSMPDYIPKVMARFCVDGIPSPQKSPAIYIPPNFGKKGPQLTYIDESEQVSPEKAKYIQQVVVALLYYAIAVDNTILPSVTSISSAQANPTSAVFKALQHLLGYVALNPDNKLVFRASDMILHVQSDGSHLSETKSRSRAGGIFYLGDSNNPTRINGLVDVMSSIIPVVTAAASETEYGSVFMNGRKAQPLQLTLADLGYKQSKTVILCDNSCAVGLAQDTIKAKHSKAIAMRFHWVRDRVKQGQFKVIWREGQHNLADFFTKPLPIHEFQKLRHFFVRVPTHSPQHTVPIGSPSHIKRSQAWKNNQPTANVQLYHRDANHSNRQQVQQH